MFSTTVIAEDIWSAYGNPNVEKRLDYIQLLGDNGLQDCLGFEAEQCGITRENLLGVTEPAQLSIDSDASTKHLFNSRPGHNTAFSNTKFSNDAIAINNDTFIGYRAKKRKLKKLWESKGWKLIFVHTVAQMNRIINNLKARGE